MQKAIHLIVAVIFQSAPKWWIDSRTCCTLPHILNDLPQTQSWMQNTHTLQAGTDIKEKTYNGYGHQLVCTSVSHLFPTFFAYSLVICNRTTWRVDRETQLMKNGRKRVKGDGKRRKTKTLKKERTKSRKKRNEERRASWWELNGAEWTQKERCEDEGRGKRATKIDN